MRLLTSLVATALVFATSTYAEEFSFDPEPSETATTFETETTVEQSAVEPAPAATPSYASSYAAATESVEEAGSFPNYYGWAYAAGMSGNAAIANSAPDFLVFPDRVQGNQFLMVDHVNKQGMFALSAFDGGLFGYVNLSSANPGRLYLGYSGGNNSFGGGFFTSINSSYNKTVNYSYTAAVGATPATTTSTTTEVDLAQTEVYGLFGSFALPSITAYASVEYQMLESKDSIFDTSTQSGEINFNQTAIKGHVGAFAVSGIHAVDGKITITSASHKIDNSVTAKATSVNTSSSPLGAGNYIQLRADLNYGAAIVSTDDYKIYGGSALGFVFTSFDDLKPNKSIGSTSRKDQSSTSFFITPNFGAEYLLSKNILLFSSVQHVIARNGSSTSTEADTGTTTAPVEPVYYTNSETESNTLNNATTSTNIGVRWSLKRLSVEALLGANLFTAGTSAIFNSGLGLASTTVTFSF